MALILAAPAFATEAAQEAEGPADEIGDPPAGSGPRAGPRGWRGDGTGCYPDARPPTEWGRISKTLKDLSAQAQKPTGDAPGGQGMTDGVVRDWLILGPVPVPEGATLATSLIPDEAQLQPDEGETTAGLTWKAIKAESAYLDFNMLLGNDLKGAAYAHTYIYSKAAHPVLLIGTYHGGLRCWLNGKQVWSGDKAWCTNAVLNVTQGWNRLLFKIVSDGQCYFGPQFFGRAPYEYETKNIVWTCAMPGSGNASPIIVGDRIFATSETYDLTCVSKADGKILWVRSATYFDTLTEEDKQGNPAFQPAVPLAERLKHINDAYSGPTPPTPQLVNEKHALEKQIYKIMAKVDRKRYRLLDGQDAGYAGMTPVSDGTFVYVWYATGITVCYDLDGDRKWIRLDNDRAMREHGLASSPVLAGGKLIVHMNETLGLDAATGAVVWRLPREFFQASLVAFTLGNEPLFLTANFSVRRAGDGKALFVRKGDGTIPTPVVKGGVIHWLGGGGVETFRLPASAAEPFNVEQFRPGVKIPVAGFPQFFGGWTTASPLVHDGLLYCVNIDGVLSVVDIDAGRLLYQKLLDVNVANHHNMKAARGLGSSPTLAGRYIYVFGNMGTAVVLEPGRTFKQVAKNRLENSIGHGQWWEHQETSVSTPVFDGEYLYYRAEETLYCVGEK